MKENEVTTGRQSGKGRRHIYDLEATGLIVIAVVILLITLIRYWHNISWSAR